MDLENKQWLNRLRHHRQTQVAAEFIGQIQPEEREALLRIAQQEFDPKYTACLTCPEELYRLVDYVYTQEEKTLPNEEADFQAADVSSEPAGTEGPGAEPTESGTVHLTFPKQEPEEATGSEPTKPRGKAKK